MYRFNSALEFLLKMSILFLLITQNQNLMSSPCYIFVVFYGLFLFHISEVGITLILCLAVYLSLVNKKMPSTSEAFPLVTKFYGCVIIELTVAMICSCYCLHIYDPEGLRLYRFPRNLRVRKSAKYYFF